MANKKNRLKEFNYLLLISIIFSLLLTGIVIKIYTFNKSEKSENENQIFYNIIDDLKYKKFSVSTQNEDNLINIKIERNNLKPLLNEIEHIANKYKCIIKEKNTSDERLSLELLLNESSFIKLNIFIENLNEKPPLVTFENNKEYNEIAIIIDDAGYNSKLIDEFLSFPEKLTISVLPCMAQSFTIAQKIVNAGKEVMLHLPMEPENNKKANGIECEILTSMDELEIYKIFQRALSSVPYAVGVNNHQGSKATADLKTMKSLLKLVKEQRMFFIDSLTSPKSVSRQVSNFLKVPYAQRDVFLDNKDDYNYIKGQMDKLIKIAIRKGRAIGIGHINCINTLRVLNDSLSVLKSNNIKLVFASEIINELKNKEVN